MALSRFFGRGRGDTPAAPPPPEADTDAEDVGFEVDVEPEAAEERSWQERAEAVLPTGASTGSKRAAALYGENAPALPTHFVSARGVTVTDVHGEQFVDCTMALGAVALGYAEPRVTEAVIRAAGEGNVSALSSWREVEVAERLRAVIPCAERVQLLKTGAEATAAAVRLARVHTGREQVIACGYFGWHDWCSDSAGVPVGVRKSVSWVPFDEPGALDLAVAAAGQSLAAIIVEPIVEQLPSAEWLERMRALCDETGAVLIFDEVKTGFRVAPGGYQEVCGVTPDLATFGKALANGYPLAAVVGKQAVMDAARDTWISSTLASESVALAAAIAVLEWHEEADICATLAENGAAMRAAVERAIAASGMDGVTTDGIDQMWRMRWDDAAREQRFVSHAMQSGVLFKRGAYNFAAVAHDETVQLEVERAASAALVAMLEEENH
jgi:glutamate-1-semialdehyde 2,1-aminomutase